MFHIDIYRTAAVIIGLSVLCACTDVYAMTATDTLGGVTFTVFAPDWTWQKRDINVLVVLTNSGNKPERVTVELDLPAGKEDHFQVETPLTYELNIPAGKTVRHAFTNIHAQGGVPRQTYKFAIVLRSASAEVRLPYPLKTIRGAAVSPGAWAVIVPAGLAFAWCIVFAIAMRKLAGQGAWRTSGPSVDEPEETEPWIRAEPTK